MTTISMSSTAKDPDEVISELRKMADFIEGLAAVENAKVTVTGELNLVVDYRRAADRVTSRWSAADGTQVITHMPVNEEPAEPEPDPRVVRVQNASSHHVISWVAVTACPSGSYFWSSSWASA